MKNTIFKLTEIFILFFIISFINSLFISWKFNWLFLYGNLGKQPDLIANPIGTSINHLIFFSYITILAIYKIKKKKYFH